MYVVAAWDDFSSTTTKNCFKKIEIVPSFPTEECFTDNTYVKKVKVSCNFIEFLKDC